MTYRASSYGDDYSRSQRKSAYSGASDGYGQAGSAYGNSSGASDPYANGGYGNGAAGYEATPAAAGYGGGAGQYGRGPSYGQQSYGTSGYGGGRGDFDFSQPVEKPDPSSLIPFEKNFYKEHPDVTARSAADVQMFRKQHNIICRGDDTPRPITTFAEASFPDYAMKAIIHAGFQNPTAIQSQAWPVCLAGRDFIGIAETGSGKTLSFMLPAFVHINAQPRLARGDGPVALVLAPTRELAVQIQTETNKFIRGSGLRCVVCYGGSDKGAQSRQLRAGAEIVVATPGRLNDLLNSGITNLRRVTYLVLDEADRMLDMGFEPQIRRIVDQIRDDRQTVMFTATWPKDVVALSRDFLNDPIQVNIGSLDLAANTRVQQEFRFVQDHEKMDSLLDVMQKDAADGSRILIFTSTKRSADDVTAALRRNGFEAISIHGDKAQSERDWALSQFRTGRSPVLVATDVAARGLGMFSPCVRFSSC